MPASIGHKILLAVLVTSIMALLYLMGMSVRHIGRTRSSIKSLVHGPGHKDIETGWEYTNQPFSPSLSIESGGLNPLENIPAPGDLPITTNPTPGDPKKRRSSLFGESFETDEPSTSSLSHVPEIISSPPTNPPVPILHKSESPSPRAAPKKLTWKPDIMEFCTIPGIEEPND